MTRNALPIPAHSSLPVSVCLSLSQPVFRLSTPLLPLSVQCFTRNQTKHASPHRPTRRGICSRRCTSLPTQGQMASPWTPRRKRGSRSAKDKLPVRTRGLALICATSDFYLISALQTRVRVTYLLT